MSFEDWEKENVAVADDGFAVWQAENAKTPQERSAEIEAKIRTSEERLTQSYPGLYDSPIAPKMIDTGAMIEDYSIRSGLDESDLIGMAAGLDETDPEFKAKFEQQIQRRQYKNVLDELQWGTAGGLLNTGSAVAGTVSAAERFLARSPIFYPLTRFGPLKESETVLELDEDAQSWEAKAAELYDWARQPEMQASAGGGIRGFMAYSLGQTLPMMTASVAAGATVGPAGAWAVAATIEGDNWYREAIANGASPEEAGIGRVVVGSVNGFVELAQVGGILRIGKGASGPALDAFKAAIRDRALTKLAATTGRMTAQSVLLATQEGAEEVIQEWVGEGSAVAIYDKKVDLKDLGLRTAQSFAGGASAGWLLGGGSLVIFGEQTKAEAEAAPLEKPPMIATEQEVKDYEDQRVEAQAAAEAAEAGPGAGVGPAAPVETRPQAAEPQGTAEEVTPAVAEPAKVQGKQPWEMTREDPSFRSFRDSTQDQENLRELKDQGITSGEEWKRRYQDNVIRYADQYLELGFKEYYREPVSYWLDAPLDEIRTASALNTLYLGRSRFQREAATWLETGRGDVTRGAIQQEHKRSVQHAIEYGLPVPRAVLEEYSSEPWAKEALAKLGTTTIGPQGQEQATGGQPAQPPAGPALPETPVVPQKPAESATQAELPVAGEKQAPQQAPGPKTGQQPSAPGEIGPPARAGATVEGVEGQPEPAPAAPGTALDADEPRLASARQAWINRNRRKLGMDAINSPARRSWLDAMTQAWEEGIPENALRIAGEIAAKPRALSDIETAGLVIRLVELENEHEGLMAKIGPEKDPASTADLSARASTAEAEYDTISKAIHRSGSEKGRALAAQKMTINENFSLVSVKARAKAAKGSELTAAETAKLAELTEKLSSQSAKVEALEKELNRMKAEQMLKKLRGTSRLAAMTAEQKATERQTLVDKIRKLAEAGC